MDVSTELMNVVSLYGGYIVFLGAVVSLLIIFYVIINSRYPVVVFDVIEGRRKIRTTRRLIGEKVVKDSLLEILLHGERLFGFKISEYDYYYDGDTRCYFATKRGEDLIPYRINQEGVDIAELGMGREIAVRYINAIDSVKGDLDKQNPLVLALISVIPIAVLVLLTGVMFYLILNDALPKMLQVSTQVSSQALEMAKINAQISENMVKVSSKIDTPSVVQNSTIVVS